MHVANKYSIEVMSEDKKLKETFFKAVEQGWFESGTVQGQTFLGSVEGNVSDVELKW